MTISIGSRSQSTASSPDTAGRPEASAIFQGTVQPASTFPVESMSRQTARQTSPRTRLTSLPSVAGGQSTVLAGRVDRANIQEQQEAFLRNRQDLVNRLSLRQLHVVPNSGGENQTDCLIISLLQLATGQFHDGVQARAEQVRRALLERFPGEGGRLHSDDRVFQWLCNHVFVVHGDCQRRQVVFLEPAPNGVAIPRTQQADNHLAPVVIANWGNHFEAVRNDSGRPWSEHLHALASEPTRQERLQLQGSLLLGAESALATSPLQAGFETSPSTSRQPGLSPSAPVGADSAANSVLTEPVMMAPMTQPQYAWTNSNLVPLSSNRARPKTKQKRGVAQFDQLSPKLQAICKDAMKLVPKRGRGLSASAIRIYDELEPVRKLEREDRISVLSAATGVRRTLLLEYAYLRGIENASLQPIAHRLRETVIRDSLKHGAAQELCNKHADLLEGLDSADRLAVLGWATRLGDTSLWNTASKLGLGGERRRNRSGLHVPSTSPAAKLSSRRTIKGSWGAGTIKTMSPQEEQLVREITLSTPQASGEKPHEWHKRVAKRVHEIASDSKTYYRLIALTVDVAPYMLSREPELVRLNSDEQQLADQIREWKNRRAPTRTLAALSGPLFQSFPSLRQLDRTTQLRVLMVGLEAAMLTASTVVTADKVRGDAASSSTRRQ